MRFSKTELKALEQIGNGNKQVSTIAKVLKKSKSQMYRICEKLSEKGIVTIARGVIDPTKKTHVSLLLQIITEFPNLANRFSGTGLKIYMSILEPKTVAEIEKETKLHRTTIFKELCKGRNISLAYPEGRTYKINEKLWQKAKEFLKELKKYEELIDSRVPPSAIIYFKNEEEIIFSTREDLDATLTAFSVYEKYGIKLYNITQYFYLPKKELNKEEIFLHSVYVAEKDLHFWSLMYVALFYAKYRKKLSYIKHPIVENFDKIFDGQKIPGYPPLKEIQEKLEIYDIKLLDS